MKRQKPRLTYTERLLIAYQQLHLPPQYIIANVQHDSHCPCLRGKPHCRCSPDIVLTTTAGKIEVLDDGTCRHTSTLN